MTEIISKWQCPNYLKQDYSYKTVNGGTCYQFHNFDAIKKNDLSYAYQSYKSGGRWRAGTSNKRASPIVYAYDYRFNIPKKSIINYIEIEYVVKQRSYTSRQNLTDNFLRLKTTSSLTDKASNSKNYKKNGKWSKGWNTRIVKITQKDAHVKLTPELINSSNFGLVYQCVGTMNLWDDATIARMRIRVAYTDSKSSVDNTGIIPDMTISARIRKVALQTLNIQYPNDKTWLDITYTTKEKDGKYVSGTSPEVYLYSDSNNYLFSEKKIRTYSVQPIQIKESKKSVTYTSSVEVYPFSPSPNAEIKLRYKIQGKLYNLKVKLPVQEFSDSGTVFKDNIDDQGCFITNNVFDNCRAPKGGGYGVDRLRSKIIGPIVKATIQQEVVPDDLKKYWKDGKVYSRVDMEGYAIDLANDTRTTLFYRLPGNAEGRKPDVVSGDKIKGKIEIELPCIHETIHGTLKSYKVYDNKKLSTPDPQNMLNVTDYFKWNEFSQFTKKHTYISYLEYDFKDENTYKQLKDKGFEGKIRVQYNYYTPILKLSVFAKNNSHRNFIDIDKYTWCKYPTSYIKGVAESYVSEKWQDTEYTRLTEAKFDYTRGESKSIDLYKLPPKK